MPIQCHHLGTHLQSGRGAHSVRLLLIAPSYPHPAAEWAGAPNEHSVAALRTIVEHVEVVVPRPFAPRFLAFNDRWRAYAFEPKKDVRRGVMVHRPSYPHVPRIMRGFWPTTAAFFFCRQRIKRLHERHDFDAILSFDLANAGGLAWRLGRYLGVPACGWATGSDIRWGGRSSIGRAVRKTLTKLDLVFYQSTELKSLAAGLLGASLETLSTERH